MSSPGWKSLPPVKGSRRLPKADVSQPATGQMEGVASASERRLSTPGPHGVEAMLDGAQDVAHHAERRVAGAEGIADHVPGNAAAHGARADGSRQPLHGPAGLGIDGRRGTDFVDGGLQRRDLRRELAGGVAIVVVFDRQAGVGRRQFVEGCQCAPARAESDQDRQGERGHDGRNGRSQREGEPTDDPAFSVGDDNGIPSGRHSSPRPPPPRRGPNFSFVEPGNFITRPT